MAQPNQTQSLSAIRDYDELVATLEQLVRRSRGAAEPTYSPFRAKSSGRAIPIVTVGNGDRGIVIIANQHGDEFTVSNSAVELIRRSTRSGAATTSTATTRIWSAIRATTRTPDRSAWARATTRCPRRWRCATRTTRRAARRASTS